MSLENEALEYLGTAFGNVRSGRDAFGNVTLLATGYHGDLKIGYVYKITPELASRPELAMQKLRSDVEHFSKRLARMGV